MLRTLGLELGVLAVLHIKPDIRYSGGVPKLRSALKLRT